MLSFRYLDEPLTSTAPPSLAAGSQERWRPLVPARIIGPTGRSRRFLRTLVDPGADDTVFPLDIASLLDVALLPDTGHRILWRGQRYPLRYGEVEFELADGVETVRWGAVVAFTPANVRYPLFGNAGSLEFFDVTFRGEQRVIELNTNSAFAGTVTR